MEEAGTFDIEYFLGPDVSTSLSSFAVTMTGVRDGFASIDFFTPATKEQRSLHTIEEERNRARYIYASH